ncbi:MAG TPA: glucose/sorbosone family PQQ-dependent dehydrogenase [Polyangiales bacterium]|nr:glucose/sorbosone family PQQ-dependent dehydrogenase [Polyangiales bacterium]
MKSPLSLIVIMASLVFAATSCSDSDSPDAASRDAANPGLDSASADAASSDAAPPTKPDAEPDPNPRDASAPQDAARAPDPPDAGTGPVISDAAPPDAAHDSGTVEEDSGVEPDAGPLDAGPPNEDTFALRVVALDLEAPWEVAWGPDNQLWITERVGKRVIRVDPTSGAKTTALSVTAAYQAAGQDGVLGMALDPRLGHASGGDYVYLAYTYDADASGAIDRRAKIVRYTYDGSSHTLGSAVTLIDGMPASTDHNSGRLAFGPDDRLYYTIGDQGKNQFENMCFENRAQYLPFQAEVDQADWSAYQGKVLRLELDGSIPSDNPLIGGVRSHIYSYGHRNAQGIVFGPDGKLYADEQGPKTDDEINWIRAGNNYGWPQVAGYQDDKAYVYGNWSASAPEPCANLTFSDYAWPAAVPETRESEWSSPDFTPPLMTFYTVNDGYEFMDPACAGIEFICWPTIAPSSLDIYVAGNDGLQTWGTSLLLTSLKTGSVFRVHLSANGETTVGAATELFKTTNRYRDLAIAPDKRTFYVITDSDGSTSGPTSGSTQELDHRGAILEFSYTP